MPSDPRNRDPGATARRRAAPDWRGELGRRGEDLACARLAESGLRVVARNWRCRLGEIDVIAAARGLLVFCEVKTRRGDAFGTAAAAVTPAKQARLRRLAAAYLSSVDQGPCKVRFDVVTVTWPRGATGPGGAFGPGAVTESPGDATGPRGAAGLPSVSPAVEHLEGVF